ncbi:hypothetical protein GGR54DRAFT_246727 [Hypoxylon sp. NC1633]|nr:hypothetical protein GGR54DRAFT_246727 [Hypoxylon sp. NC1633]
MADTSFEQHTTQKTGVRHDPELIRFVLERTVPSHPVARGRQKKVFAEVAQLVNETFPVEKPLEVQSIKYITNMYGRDPKYGNRKGRVIYPAKGKEHNKSSPDIQPLEAKRTRCPVCSGKGYLNADDPGRPVDSTQLQPGGRSAQRSAHTPPVTQVSPGIPYLGRSSAVNLEAKAHHMPPAGIDPAALIPNSYPSMQQPSPMFPQQAQRLTGTMPTPGHDSSITSGGPRDVLKQNTQSLEIPGAWRGSTGDFPGSELQPGWPLDPSMLGPESAADNNFSDLNFSNYPPLDDLGLIDADNNWLNMAIPARAPNSNLTSDQIVTPHTPAASAKPSVNATSNYDSGLGFSQWANFDDATGF